MIEERSRDEALEQSELQHLVCRGGCQDLVCLSTRTAVNFLALLPQRQDRVQNFALLMNDARAKTWRPRIRFLAA
jgi:hypothetical protein